MISGPISKNVTGSYRTLYNAPLFKALIYKVGQTPRHELHTCRLRVSLQSLKLLQKSICSKHSIYGGFWYNAGWLIRRVLSSVMGAAYKRYLLALRSRSCCGLYDTAVQVLLKSFNECWEWRYETINTVNNYFYFTQSFYVGMTLQYNNKSTKLLWMEKKRNKVS